MTDDIVAELDRWLEIEEHPPDGVGLIAVDKVRRARDVIVALEEMRQAHIRMLAANQDDARDEALEEAARECDEEAKGSGGEVAFRDGCETCAAAIRLLKGKH